MHNFDTDIPHCIQFTVDNELLLHSPVAESISCTSLSTASSKHRGDI